MTYSISETLAQIREKMARGEFPKHKHFWKPMTAYWPAQHFMDITDRDPWRDRMDHPKD